MADLDEKRARAAVGSAMAAIEEDCSRAWPQCPREGPLCDCRLRAVMAVNAVKRVLSHG